MQTGKNLNSTSTIRFRRWSRKGYAIFVGLNKVINIGRVSSAIAEKSLLKSGVFPDSNYFIQNKIKEEEQEELRLDEQQLQILAILTEAIAPVSFSHYNYLFQIAGL